MTSRKQTDNPIIHKHELTGIVEGAGIIFIGKILGSGLQYIYLIIVAKILGVELFGIFILGVTIISFASVISRLGLDNGVVRYVSLYIGSGDRERGKGTIVQSMKYAGIVGIVFGILLYVTAGPFFANYLNKPELEGTLKLLSFAVPFISLMMIALASTQGFKIMRYTVFGQNLFWPILNIILVSIFFFMGFKLNGVVIAYGLSLLFTSLLSFHYLVKVFPDILHIQKIKENRKLFRFSLPLLLLIVFTSIIQWTDTLMLGYFRSSSEVGIYNVAMRTALLINIILVSFNAIFGPIIADLHHKKENRKIEKLYKTTTKWIYTASFAAFLLILLLSKEMMFVFGQEFLTGGSILIVLGFSQFVCATAGSAGLILVMSNKQDLMIINTLFICTANIFLNYLLIPSYGITGASIASAISLISLNVIMIIEIKLILKIHPYSRKYLKPTAIGILVLGIMYLINYAFPELESFQKMFVIIPSFLGAYILLLYRWGIDEEDRIIIDVFKNKLMKFKP